MNKTVFVTGASQVTGKGIAIAFGKAGYDVGISYVHSTEGAMDAVRQLEGLGVRAKAYKCDVRDYALSRDTIGEFVSDFGKIDVMVNNTGITRHYDFLDTTEDQYDEVFDINLKGTYFTAQAAARKMVEAGGGGVIINISSVHALGTWPGDTLYATTKAALNRLTEAMALDLAKHKIRVVSVAPGYVDMNRQKNDAAAAERMKIYEQRIPLGRYVGADEIGDICVFMASDSASYITGTTLYAEGGILLPVSTENEYN